MCIVKLSTFLSKPGKKKKNLLNAQSSWLFYFLWSRRIMKRGGEIILKYNCCSGGAL